MLFKNKLAPPKNSSEYNFFTDKVGVLAVFPIALQIVYRSNIKSPMIKIFDLLNFLIVKS